MQSGRKHDVTLKFLLISDRLFEVSCKFEMLNLSFEWLSFCTHCRLDVK